jgi:hypothetical protein
MNILVAATHDSADYITQLKLANPTYNFKLVVMWVQHTLIKDHLLYAVIGKYEDANVRTTKFDELWVLNPGSEHPDKLLATLKNEVNIKCTTKFVETPRILPKSLKYRPDCVKKK